MTDQADSSRAEERDESPAQAGVETSNAIKKARTPEARTGEPVEECVNIAEIGAQGFVELPDGTHHGLAEGNVKVPEAELQRQLREKGIAELSQEKIAELREFGMVTPAEVE